MSGWESGHAELMRDDLLEVAAHLRAHNELELGDNVVHVVEHLEELMEPEGGRH